MARPSINTRCVADSYANRDVERIAEVNAKEGGALVSARRNIPEDRLTINVYRMDESVDVSVGHNDKGHAPAVYIGGKRVPDLGHLLAVLDMLAVQNAGPAIPLTGRAVRAGSVVRPMGSEVGSHILVRREDWQALVELRAAIRGEG
jgi:hypothetical protein